MNSGSSPSQATFLAEGKTGSRWREAWLQQAGLEGELLCQSWASISHGALMHTGRGQQEALNTLSLESRAP